MLSPARAAERISIGRVDAPQDLAWCLDYLWWVRWDTPQTYTQNLLSRPVVHLSAEERHGECRIWVTGITTNLFARQLRGVGRTVGAAFRPGGMRPFTSGYVADLTDQVIPAQEVIGLDDRETAMRLVHDSLSEDEAARLLAQWLASRIPIIDPRVDEVAALVERVERRSVHRERPSPGGTGRGVATHAATKIPYLRRRRSEVGDSTAPLARRCRCRERWRRG